MGLTISLTPAQMARHLGETFGYSVSSSVVVKYDNEIIKKEHFSSDGGSRRNYTMADVELFNAIFVMRNLGYSVEMIRDVFAMDLREAPAQKECGDFLSSVQEKVNRQKKGLELFAGFMTQLKNMRPHEKSDGSFFKAATPAMLENRKKVLAAANKKEAKGKA